MKQCWYLSILEQQKLEQDPESWRVSLEGTASYSLDEATYIYVGGVLPQAMVFDCRALPTAFVMDTGEAVLEELEATKTPTVLPFPHCYFEFANHLALLAGTAGYAVDDDEEHVELEVMPVRVDTFRDDGEKDAEGRAMFWHGIATLPNFVDDKMAKPYIELHPRETDPLAREGAILLLGVLTLLNERLVLQDARPDPSPKLTRARAKRGTYPISGPSVVLTVNVPMVRQAARHNPLAKHESPLLHWRRGHKRVLHRGSEFETIINVKRCLVGDPDKGFLRKSYRLIHETPLGPGGVLQ